MGLLPTVGQLSFHMQLSVAKKKKNNPPYYYFKNLVLE